MKKTKTNPLKLCLVLIILFGIFLYIFLKPYDYEKKYQVNKFKVTEKYNKKKHSYEFIINYNGNNYPFVVENNYLRKRELISEIKLVKEDSELCILPVGKDLIFYPLCSTGKDIYTYNLSNIKDLDYNYQDINEINKKYKNIDLNYLGDLKILINNYQGFYLLSKEEQKDLKLFSRDVYTMDLIYQTANSLIVPDYSEDHYFKKIFIINVQNAKVKEIELKDSISFDSVFLGEFKNSVYLLDKKEEQEYRIDVNKKRIEKVDFQIVEKDKLKKTTFKDIVNHNLNMLTKSSMDYTIIDDNLYMIINNEKIKISNKKVARIIQNNLNEVYYLVDDTLYMYNNVVGEIKLLSSFEWNFNNYNNIFIFK